jgi:hypothetical protein
LKIKCISGFKHNGKAGILQVFYNKSKVATYSRLRQYKGLDSNKKPIFIYTKIPITADIQELLKAKLESLEQKQLGQSQANSYIDQNSKSLRPNRNIKQNSKCLGSLARWGVTLVR